jgi:hypothetical protein
MSQLQFCGASVNITQPDRAAILKHRLEPEDLQNLISARRVLNEALGDVRPALNELPDNTRLEIRLGIRGQLDTDILEVQRDGSTLPLIHREATGPDPLKKKADEPTRAYIRRMVQLALGAVSRR